MGGGFKPSIVDPGGLSLLVLWSLIIARSVNDIKKKTGYYTMKKRGLPEETHAMPLG